MAFLLYICAGLQTWKLFINYNEKANSKKSEMKSMKRMGLNPHVYSQSLFCYQRELA